MKHPTSTDQTSIGLAPRLSHWALLSVALVALAYSPCPAQAGAPLVAPPHSHAYGNSLEGWLGVYWRWFILGQDPETSLVNGVKLLALPNGEYISGSGTPEDPALYRGHIEITLDSQTPFVLPLAGWITEIYNNGNPEDAFIPDDVFLGGISPEFSINGTLVVSDANDESFYVPPTPFDPVINYAAPTSYGSIAATGFQSIGLVGRALPVGVHTLHLYEPYVIPGLFGVIFDNTWVITVNKKSQ